MCLSMSDPQKADRQSDLRWFVLNYFSPVSSRKEASAENCIDNFNRRLGTDLKLFCPTFISYRQVKGERKKVDRPLVYHYTFVRGSLPVIKKLCAENNNFSFVLNKSAEDRYAVVDDITMENFRKVSAKYSNNVPFYPLDGVELADFDKVQIVEGDFPGLVGYYSSQKGSNAGRIILEITQDMGTVIYDVKAKYVRILEFSKNFKRAYDIIDAFLPKLYEAIKKHRREEQLSENDISSLHSFCRRMECCKLNNPKIDAKLQAILVMANKILGNEKAMAEAEARYEKKKASVTAPTTKALVTLLLGLAHDDTSSVDAARALLPSTLSHSPSLHSLLTLLKPLST